MNPNKVNSGTFRNTISFPFNPALDFERNNTLIDHDQFWGVLHLWLLPGETYILGTFLGRRTPILGTFEESPGALP
jgi:hypothetical protein